MSKKATRRAARDAFPKAKTPTAPVRPTGGKYSSKNAKVKAKAKGTQALKPPSWKRAVIQGFILAAIYFIMIFFWQRDKGLNIWGALLIAFVGFVFFSAIAYYIDRLTYNRKLRKLKSAGK